MKVSQNGTIINNIPFNKYKWSTDVRKELNQRKLKATEELTAETHLPKESILGSVCPNNGNDKAYLALKS